MTDLNAPARADTPSDSALPLAAYDAKGATRRRWVLGSVAAVAGLSGLGAAWWRTQEPSAPAPGALANGFWDMQWDTPQGGVVRMDSFRGRPVLVNFWATWCPPCVEELPLINSFFVENKPKGWQVLGLAVDKMAPVQAFLQKMPLQFPVGVVGGSGAELARSMGNLVGGLPFSVLIGGEGGVLHRKMGRVTPADLAAWVRLK